MAAGTLTSGTANSFVAAMTALDAGVTLTGAAGEEVQVIKEGSVFHWYHISSA